MKERKLKLSRDSYMYCWQCDVYACVLSWVENLWNLLCFLSICRKQNIIHFTKNFLSSSLLFVISFAISITHNQIFLLPFFQKKKKKLLEIKENINFSSTSRLQYDRTPIIFTTWVSGFFGPGKEREMKVSHADVMKLKEKFPVI